MSTTFTTRLLRWHKIAGRKDLPWQKNNDAYGIWVSEIMLQQTQVQTVIPYYLRFMRRFPSILDLAQADEDDVLHHWSGLGYYARARNLHRAAQIIENDHNGNFPQQFDDVLALPGIGKSTAGAILAFAFQQPHPILDGNVKRVLCRFHGVEGYPGKKQVETKLWEIAAEHTPANSTATYTQAIMDLGATCCTRRHAQCEKCPQQTDCIARKNNRVDELPHRKPKALSRKKKAVYMVIVRDQTQRIALFKRPTSGIWGGLYSFPEFETRPAVDEWISQQLNANYPYEESDKIIKHSFTHFDLSIRPLYIKATQTLTQTNLYRLPSLVWFDSKQPHRLGLPTPVQTIIDAL